MSDHSIGAYVCSTFSDYLLPFFLVGEEIMKEERGRTMIIPIEKTHLKKKKSVRKL